MKVELGLFEEEEEKRVDLRSTRFLLDATEEMLRIKDRWRCDFSSLAACFSNVL